MAMTPSTCCWHCSVPLPPAVRVQRRADGTGHPRLATAPGEEGVEAVSPRERQIAEGVVRGHSSAAIVEQRRPSPKTVETCLSRLMGKLGMSDLPARVRRAIRDGWSDSGVGHRPQGPRHVLQSGLHRGQRPRHEELLGQPHNLVRHTDMPAEAFRDKWATIGRGLRRTGFVKNLRKNGDSDWVQVNATPMKDGECIVGFLSVRKQPSRGQVAGAEALHATMRTEAASGRLARALTPGQRGRLLVALLNSRPASRRSTRRRARWTRSPSRKWRGSRNWPLLRRS